jgi:hypothetical protein
MQASEDNFTRERVLNDETRVAGAWRQTPRHANFYVGERVAKDARLGIDAHSAAL